MKPAVALAMLQREGQWLLQLESHWMYLGERGVGTDSRTARATPEHVGKPSSSKKFHPSSSYTSSQFPNTTSCGKYHVAPS